jgi:uncharacterized membrane protein YidH (DUF202 family)
VCVDDTKALIIQKVELLLAEKMAILATMRTGIAIITLPFSVLTILIATSDYYSVSKVVWLLGIVYVLCGILAAVGGYLVFRSIRKIHRLDRKIEKIKASNRFMNNLMVE